MTSSYHRKLKKLAFFQTKFNENNPPLGFSVKEYKDMLFKLQKEIDEEKQLRKRY
jgi:hypothetical protein